LGLASVQLQPSATDPYGATKCARAAATRPTFSSFSQVLTGGGLSRVLQSGGGSVGNRRNVHDHKGIRVHEMPAHVELYIVEVAVRADTPLWFRNADLGMDGTNDPAAERRLRTPWSTT
jgi:hypothetical protein